MKEKTMNFELKEKDMFTPVTIAYWITETIKHNNNAKESEIVVSKAKIAKAARHLADILDYQYKNGCVIPD